jgi:hypothetical protein
VKKLDPFAVETVKLRVPLAGKEVTVEELNFRPPTLKDAMATDSCKSGTVEAAIALMESLTGVSAYLLEKLVPEDWADCAVVLARTNMRFLGELNLIDGGNEADPTRAAGAVQQKSSPPDSAA